MSLPTYTEKETRLAMMDYIKHTNTISTGVLIALTVFLDKLTLYDRSWLLLISMILFLYSILSGISGLLMNFTSISMNHMENWERKWYTLIMYAHTLTFGVGISVLVSFAMFRTKSRSD